MLVILIVVIKFTCLKILYPYSFGYRGLTIGNSRFVLWSSKVGHTDIQSVKRGVTWIPKNSYECFGLTVIRTNSEKTRNLMMRSLQRTGENGNPWLKGVLS